MVNAWLGAFQAGRSPPGGSSIRGLQRAIHCYSTATSAAPALLLLPLLLLLCSRCLNCPHAQAAAQGGACTQKFLEDEGWACRLPGIVLANQVRFVGPHPDAKRV
jgi:hypothetical protein